MPVLIELIRPVADGALVAIEGTSPRLGPDLRQWAQVTGHAVVEEHPSGSGAVRYVIRKGRAPVDPDSVAARGRLWLYTNYHCNLACDYCCVRSSPLAAPRVLSIDVVRRAADWAVAQGFHQICVTGGEPFLRPDIEEVLQTCADRLPTMVLTNGTLLTGPAGTALERLPRDRLALQISLDAPDPEDHDAHRGRGSWTRALAGIHRARSLGFRVRIAQTTSDPAARERMDRWLGERGFAPEDRLLRSMARRGLSTEGIALARGEVVPELTVTAQGVYWHPVGADDADFRLTPGPGELDRAVERLNLELAADRAHREELSKVFQCA